MTGPTVEDKPTWREFFSDRHEIVGAKTKLRFLSYFIVLVEPFQFLTVDGKVTRAKAVRTQC
jgi:hypothetical protein